VVPYEKKGGFLNSVSRKPVIGRYEPLPVRRGRNRGKKGLLKARKLQGGGGEIGPFRLRGGEGSVQKGLPPVGLMLQKSWGKASGFPGGEKSRARGFIRIGPGIFAGYLVGSEDGNLEMGSPGPEGGDCLSV